MKPFSRSIRRLSASALALLLALQLSGCSWFFMPGPVIITGEETAASSVSEPSSETEEPSGSVSESTSPPETPTASDTTEASSGESSSDPSADVPTDESSEATETFTVDYFRIPECLRAIASDAVFVDACNVISACLAYRTSAKVSCAKEDAGRVVYIADTLCPLLKAFTDISEDSLENGEFSWKFYVDKVAFAIVRAEFEAQVAAYIEPYLDPVYNETERALLIYHAYTAPATYNYEIISGTFKMHTEAEQHRIHSAYAGIMDHTGVCHDLAGGMTFLFIQAGFNACRVSVINARDEHSWTLLELGGRYTYCDATWDVGGYFSFFGNSSGERTTKIGGDFLLAQMNIYDYNAPEHFDIINPGFAQVQDFSYSRLIRGTPLSLTIDTAATPHKLIFTSRNASDRLVIPCP